MESKKPLEILIVEDGQLYDTFPERLSKTLRDRGYLIGNIEVMTEFTHKDGILLPKYDVVISDLGFPAYTTLSENEVKKLAEYHKEELKKVSSSFEEFGESASIAYVVRRLVEELDEDQPTIYKLLAKESQGAGFLVVGSEAKKRNRKVSFYTNDLGHAVYTVPLGIITGLITAEEIQDIIDKSPEEEVPLFYPFFIRFLKASKDGRFMVGSKKEFENWIKAVETAIKYQTK